MLTGPSNWSRGHILAGRRQFITLFRCTSPWTSGKWKRWRYAASWWCLFADRLWLSATLLSAPVPVASSCTSESSASRSRTTATSGLPSWWSLYANPQYVTPTSLQSSKRRCHRRSEKWRSQERHRRYPCGKSSLSFQVILWNVPSVNSEIRAYLEIDGFLILCICYR